MSRPQQPVSVTFVQEWRIRRPVIYRYLDKQFVDAFFETGRLRISSFAAFAEHKDEERRDSSEGVGIVHLNTEGGSPYMTAVVAQGRNAYVLCGAQNYSPGLAHAFGADSGFRINDSIGFSQAVSKHLPGFQMGLEGPCHYLANKTVIRATSHNDLISPEAKTLDLGHITQTVFAAAGDDLFFIKAEEFAHQNEYRLIWHTPSAVSGHINIVCPEAREFCTHFEDMRPEKPAPTT